MFALHERAKVLVEKYFEAEKELISLLQEIRRELIYQKLGYSSMHQYCTVALGLSDHQAYGFWAVARKCQEVPKLQEAIDAGAISVATATRLVPVIQESNSTQWLELAQAVPQKTLEREVAKANPKAAIREHIKPLSERLLEFKGAIDPETESLLLQCKELQAQKSQSAGSWNDVLKALALQYLKNNDPVEKAKRVETRKIRADQFPARKNQAPTAGTSQLL